MNNWKWTFLAVAILYIYSCKSLHVIHTAADDVQTGPEDAKSTWVEEMVAPYKVQLDAEMNKEVAQLAEDLIKEQPESSLGNHVAEVTFWEAQKSFDKKIDFAICNYGGLRVPSINKGPLQVQHAYQIMPFDNYVVVMELPNDVVLQLFNKMAANGGWPIYNASYKIDAEGKAQNIQIHGSDFTAAANPNSKTVVALSDYLANGGDKLSFLKPFTYYNTNVYLRDALVNFWAAKAEAGESVEAVIDGRVQLISDKY